ncbi:MAG: hypothetical protein U9N39_07895 [Campylobacterota bacterium]|nr:hypothetical protein [Campylobacterota bacterium]
MKFNNIKNMALALSALVVLSGCGSDDSSSEVTDMEEEHHAEKAYFVMGTNGAIYSFEDEDGEITFKDSTLVSSAGCEVGKSGMSATEEGVLVYSNSTLYLIDSHGDGASHVHSDWALSETPLIGKNFDMMVGIKNAEGTHYESSKKALFFYGASSNDHYAFDTQTAALTNLNSGDTGLEEFKIENNESGRLFVWIDNKGDDNTSNDEDKVLMFKDTYSFSDDGNATYNDFYYLGHFHGESELAAHTNEEFDPTRIGAVADDAKAKALVRLNTYLKEQDTLKNILAARSELDATSICDFYTVTHNDDDYEEDHDHEDEE